MSDSTERAHEFLKRLGDEMDAVVEEYFKTHAIVLSVEHIKAAQKHMEGQVITLYDEYAYMESPYNQRTKSDG